MDTNESKAPFAFDGLDRVFHEKARLGILTSLASQPDGLSFSQLRQLCGLTDGNLSRHIQVLEAAGILALNKGYDGKRPLTMCVLTDLGRNGFLDYLAILEQVLQGATLATANSGPANSRIAGPPASAKVARRSTTHQTQPI